MKIEEVKRKQTTKCFWIKCKQNIMSKIQIGRAKRCIRKYIHHKDNSIEIFEN